ncbi:MAG: hypothetical protein M3Y30_09410 [Gemmatimonadota bacterium]|nr:hypothetical protein [Gemmatimonadota bacterium]
MAKQGTNPRESDAKRLRILSPWRGILWWGVPVAIVTAVARQDRDYGTALAGFLTANFAITLLINLAISGVIGGLIFSWLVNRFLGRK